MSLSVVCELNFRASHYLFYVRSRLFGCMTKFDGFVKSQEFPPPPLHPLPPGEGKRTFCEAVNICNSLALQPFPALTAHTVDVHVHVVDPEGVRAGKQVQRLG
jgi:hypothetical protein